MITDADIAAKKLDVAQKQLLAMQAQNAANAAHAIFVADQGDLQALILQKQIQDLTPPTP